MSGITMHEKNLTLLRVNKDADQPAHLHSLISTFVILFLEIIIDKFDTCKIPIFYPGLQIRVCIGKLFSLFLTQRICCGYSKEPTQ